MTDERGDGLDVVGGLDDGYFLYVEDMDWCKRFWNRTGVQVYFVAAMIITHGDAALAYF